MQSNRETALNYYNHKPMDHYITYLEGVQYLLESDVHHERPPYKTSGKDWFGVEWEWDAMLQTFVPDHRKKPVLDDICNWREMIKWPDLECINWEDALRIDQIDTVIDRKNFVFSFWLPNGPFERLHSLMGFEGALMAMIEEEEEVKAFLEKWTEWRCRYIDYVCKYYKPDVIQVHDDSGTSISSFYSVDTWKKLIKPCWAACAKQIKKNGVIPELHSCGKSQALLAHIGDTEFESLFIQSLNDFDYIRKSVGRTIGITPTDFWTKYEVEAQHSGITLKKFRDALHDFVKTNIESAPNDFLMLYFPSPIQIGDVPDDTVLTNTLEVMAYTAEASFALTPQFTEILRRQTL